MNVELYISVNTGDYFNWKLVELSNSIDYSLNKQFVDLEDLTSITTDYSKTVKIPMTPSNNELFNYIFKIQHLISGDYFDPTQKIDVQLRWNNNILLEGYAILKDVDTKEKNYNIIIFAETNRFLKQLLNTTILDMEGELTFPGRQRIMENIKITPYYVNQSFLNTSFVNGYIPGIVNSFNNIIGFAPQIVCNSDLLKTDCVWDKNTLSNLNMSDYVANAHSNDENYRKEYITPLLKDGVSFPQYPEINCNLTKGYFYVQAMFRIIKEYLESNQIGYKFNYDEIELVDTSFNKLCYFYKTGFNDKTGGETDKSLVIDNTQTSPSSLDLIKIGGVTTNKVPFGLNQTVPLMSNIDVDVTTEDHVNYIEVTNKLNYNTKFKYYAKVDNTFSIAPEIYNINKIRFLNLPNLPYVYIFKEDVMNGNTIASTTYYADVIVPPFACAIGQGKQVADKVVKYIKTQYTLSDSNINIKYIDNKTLHKKQKILKASDDPYRYTISVELFHDFNLSASEKTRIYTTFIPINLDQTFDTLHALAYTYEYSGSSVSPWIEPESGRNWDKYSTTSTQTVDIMFNTIRFDSSSKTKYSSVWSGLPEIIGREFKPFEWLLDFCKKYRYYIEFNELNKEITIFAHFFKNENGLKVIEKQIDYNKPISVQPIVNDYKTINFGYKSDNVNNRAKLYEDTYGVAYGDINIHTLVDISDKKLSLSKGKEIVPILVQVEALSFQDIFNWNTRSNLPLRTDFNGNIIDDTSEGKIQNNEFYLYRLGHLTIPTFRLTIYNNQMIGSNILTYYPYRQSDISQEDIDNVNVLDNLNMIPLFNYSNTQSSIGSYFNEPNVTYVKNYISKPGIYNIRWENYLDEIFDINNKKVTCYVPLSVAEYYNFRFNQLWNIEGNLFIVNKIIDFNPTNNEPTKVELIQVNNIENYN